MIYKIIRVLSFSSFVMLISCQDDDTGSDQVQSITLDVTLDSVLNGDPGIKADLDPEALEIDIIAQSREWRQVISGLSNVPEKIELDTGRYVVEIHSPGFLELGNNVDRVAFENPIFVGPSEVFEIELGDHKIIPVTVFQYNVRVNVSFDDSQAELISATDFYIEVESSEDKLLFEPGETRSGYFPAEGDLIFTLGPDPYIFSETINSIQSADNYSIQVTFAEGQTPGVSLQEQSENQTYILTVTLEEKDPGNGGTSFNIWDGPQVTFTKADGADPTVEENQDRITDNVWITRGNDGGEIYNAVTESFSDKGVSPDGTEWAIGTTAEIAQLTFDTFRNTIKPSTVVGVDLVLHLIEDDVYINLQFTSWSTNRGGGFAYVRSGE